MLAKRGRIFLPRFVINQQSIITTPSAVGLLQRIPFPSRIFQIFPLLFISDLFTMTPVTPTEVYANGLKMRINYILSIERKIK